MEKRYDIEQEITNMVHEYSLVLDKVYRELLKVQLERLVLIAQREQLAEVKGKS